MWQEDCSLLLIMRTPITLVSLGLVAVSALALVAGAGCSGASIETSATPEGDSGLPPADAGVDTGAPAAWSARYGDPALQDGYAVVSDAAGNLFVAGTLYGTADFGGGPLTSAGGADVFLVKLDASGRHVWSTRFGDASDQLVY